MPTLPVISFLGTGLMGKPMAFNIIDAGLPVTVWNRTISKSEELVAAGAKRGDSAAGAVPGSDLVLLMLVNGAVVTELLFEQGVAAACKRGTLIIDLSSIVPVIAEDHADRLKGMGLRHIDAPVSGGTVGAAKCTLAIMAGGDLPDIEEAAPVFAAMGSVTHVRELFVDLSNTGHDDRVGSQCD
jgi:2-hydroxy-3-oxopropionate reductase